MPVHRGGRPPVAAQGWALNVDGRVRNPGLFSIAQLQQFSGSDIHAPRICTGKHSLPVALHRWQGVPARQILTLVEPLSSSPYVRVYALDGHQTIITLAMLNDAMIAWGCDDLPLTPAQGAPARLIIPQRTGIKQVKWLSRLSLISADDAGASSQDDIDGIAPVRGWIDRGIDAHYIVGQPVLITGTVFAGESARPVRAELRINGGVGQPLALADSHEYGLRWRIDWTPTHAGQHSVELRVETPEGVTSDRVIVTVRSDSEYSA